MLFGAHKNIEANCCFENYDVGNEERAQHLRTLVAPAGHKDLVPGTHMVAHNHPLIPVLGDPIISDLLRSQHANDTHAYM